MDFKKINKINLKKKKSIQQESYEFKLDLESPGNYNPGHSSSVSSEETAWRR